MGPTEVVIEMPMPKSTAEQRARAIRELEAALTLAGQEADQAQLAWLTEPDEDKKFQLQVTAYDKLAATRLLRDRLDDQRRQSVQGG